MTQVENRPEGMATVSPHLICDGAAAAIDFYAKAFGAEEMTRLAAPDGKLMHAAIRLNGASVLLVDENVGMGMLGPERLKGTPVTIHLIVADADACAARAAAAGATVVMPVAKQFWGDRYGVVEDPFGHRWSVSTPGDAMSAAELEEAARHAC